VDGQLKKLLARLVEGNKMAVNFERFRRWIENRFDDVLVQKSEIRINSIFDPSDTNHHLWLSPSGGKKKRKTGVFHCFKTDRKGSLVSFVSLVDGCDKEDALAILRGEPTVRELEQQLDDFFNQQDYVAEEPVKSDLSLPIGSLLISDLPEKNWWRKKSVEYLLARKIPVDGLYICTEVPYKARIIIPYYDKSGKLIYWNGRHISSKSKMRYLGPPKEIGVGKGDVIYVPGGKWPKAGELLHICEGEFNAMSLKLSDLYAAACGGKNMTDKQALMLAEYRICLCLDRDKAGKAGTGVMSNAVTMLSSSSKTKDKLFYVRPPVGCKDWNEMYVKEGDVMVHHYIHRYAKPVDFNAPSGMVSDWFRFSDL
jgi:hypothetical protein